MKPTLLFASLLLLGGCSKPKQNCAVEIMGLQQTGEINCFFDGPTTLGDLVTTSMKTAGYCHDTGYGMQDIAKAHDFIGVVESTNVGTGYYPIKLIAWVTK